MVLYDRMYLLTEDQYRSRLSSQSAEGVLGDVQESQVNNIELSHGGTVVIGPGSYPNGKGGGVSHHVNDGGDGLTNAVSRSRGIVGKGTKMIRSADKGAFSSNSSSEAGGDNNIYSELPSQRDIYNNKERPRDVDYMEVDEASPVTRSTIANSRARPRTTTALNRTIGSALNAVEDMEVVSNVRTPGRSPRTSTSLRRQAIEGSTSEKNSIQKKALDKVIHRRLDQLQGKKIDRSMIDSAQEQAILHEMRDVYRAQTASQASKTPKRGEKRAMSMSILRKPKPTRAPTKKYRMDENEKEVEEEISSPPQTIIANSNRTWEEMTPVRRTGQKRGKSIIRKQKYDGPVKKARGLTDEEKEEIDREFKALEALRELEELEKLEALPSSAFKPGKRKWLGSQGAYSDPKYLQTSHYIPPEGRKRKPYKGHDYISNYDDEIESQIPYKSRTVNVY